MVLKNGDKGSLVSLLQLGLERSGYNVGKKDGIFGNKTEAALKFFQSDRGITTDGIAGRQTLIKIRPYITGYTTYTINKGDTLYTLAKEFYSTVPLIENANPNLSANNLKVGENIIIPYNFDIVATDIPYSSLLTELVAEGLAVRYPFINVSVIGYSTMNKPILQLKMGKGDNKVFVNASHHANEWITTPLSLKFAEDYAKQVVDAGYLVGNPSEYMYDLSTLYIIPMVNPDGVDLVTEAIDKKSPYYENAVKIANDFKFIPFPNGWKANIIGTDLNLNYPAMWEKAKNLKYSEGFTKPAPRDFVGTAPLSAKESMAIYNLSLTENFNITISLHTQGEEIYWQFEDYAPESGKKLGEKMAAASGYTLTNPKEFSNYAGYKDWFLMTYRKPGYTVEAGKGINPLPLSDFDDIYKNIEAIISSALIWRGYI